MYRKSHVDTLTNQHQKHQMKKGHSCPDKQFCLKQQKAWILHNAIQSKDYIHIFLVLSKQHRDTESTDPDQKKKKKEERERERKQAREEVKGAESSPPGGL